MKRKLSLALVLTMALSQVSTVSAKEFTDTKGNWAEGQIDRWSDYNVLGGYEDGSFKPSGYITRAEMLAMIDKIMHYQVEGENVYSDVNSEAWYTSSILKNAAAGNFSNDNGSIRPNEYITRQEVAVFVCNALDIETLDTNTTFADDSLIADWAKGYVSALQQAGYISGRPGNLYAPTENITRAEVVTFLDNIIKVMYTEEGTYSNNINGTVIVNTENVILKDTTIEGDLVVAAGVGEGDLTLDNVVIEGDLIVEGGGEHSIKLIGNTKVKNVSTKKVSENGVRVFVDKNVSVQNIYVGGNANTIIEGTGSIDNVYVVGGKGLNIAENTKVTNLVIDRNGLITIDGTVSNCTISNGLKNISITGVGNINSLVVNSNGVVVDGVKVTTTTIADGILNTVINGKTVSNNSTSTNAGSGATSSVDSNSDDTDDNTGGGSNTGNGNVEVTDTTAPVITEFAFTPTDTDVVASFVSDEVGSYTYKVTAQGSDTGLPSGNGTLVSGNNSITFENLYTDALNSYYAYELTLSVTDIENNTKTYTKLFTPNKTTEFPEDITFKATFLNDYNSVGDHLIGGNFGTNITDTKIEYNTFDEDIKYGVGISFWLGDGEKTSVQSAENLLLVLRDVFGEDVYNVFFYDNYYAFDIKATDVLNGKDSFVIPAGTLATNQEAITVVFNGLNTIQTTENSIKLNLNSFKEGVYEYRVYEIIHGEMATYRGPLVTSGSAIHINEGQNVLDIGNLKSNTEYSVNIWVDITYEEDDYPTLYIGNIITK